MTPENVHQGHRERLRERYEQNGLDGFSDHEILELLLNYSIAQKDTNPIGHALVRRFGSLKGVMDAPKEALMEEHAIGELSAFLLKLIPDICRRYYEQGRDASLRFSDAESLINYCIPTFVGQSVECVCAFFLNANHRLIEFVPLYYGSINAVEIHFDRLARMALQNGSAYVALAHNHFIDTIPSLQDIIATRNARDALREFKIELIDHIIVCGTEAISMRESGHLKKI